MKGPRTVQQERLRDEIAMDFMRSLFARAASAEDVISHREGSAKAAYAIADAMLEARNA